MKKLINADTSKEIALVTIEEIAQAVKKTLGPGGNPQIIQQYGQNPDGTERGPLITKDGVTVADHISFRDPAKDTIAKAILQVAQNTVNQAGDGTTTAVVLAEAIFKAGYQRMKQGSNGIQLYDALKSIKNEIIKEIDERKVPITKEDIYDVALISSNGDSEVAQIVSEAIQLVGEDGHVSIQEAYTKETFLQKVEGAFYKKGWRNFGPHGSLLVTDKSKDIAELIDPAILMYADKLDSLQDLSSFLVKLMGQDPNTGSFINVVPVFIIAHEFSDDVRNMIIQLRVQSRLPIAAIVSPFDGSPNARTQILEDIAAMTGGSVGARGILDLKDMNETHLGSAKRVEVGPNETVIYDGSGSESEVLERVKELKKLHETNMNEWDKENTRIRIGKLTGGLAIVHVGGASELEMKERKDRIEDALCAAKVAIKDGIVQGGGITLYRIAEALVDTSPAHLIMKEALKAPVKQIITNVGENPDVILSHLPEEKGYDARNKKYVYMFDKGIVDPSIVTKSALENAVSIAGLLLTTGGAIVSDTMPNDGQSNPMAQMMAMLQGKMGG